MPEAPKPNTMAVSWFYGESQKKTLTLTPKYASCEFMPPLRVDANDWIEPGWFIRAGRFLGLPLVSSDPYWP